MKKLSFICLALLLSLTFFACTSGNPAPSEPASLDTWLGSYTYHESELEYSINVFPLEDRYYATVQVDGEHPIHLLATVEGNAEEISFVFMNNMPGNARNVFHADDVLLSFRLTSDGLHTTWGALAPAGDGGDFVRELSGEEN